MCPFHFTVCRRLFAGLVIGVLAMSPVGGSGPRALSAQAVQETTSVRSDPAPDAAFAVGGRQAADPGLIAYVTDDWDAIRLVKPDGSEDRLLWAHEKDDPDNIYRVERLVWRPQHNELTFESDHEKFCSINDHDIFAIAVDGTGYRRITEAPACAALADYPKGTVHIPVSNASLNANFNGFIYFQGAPGGQLLNLPPGGTTTITFAEVADFGEGSFQVAGSGWREWNREVHIETAVDVQAGAAVTTRPMSVYEGSLDIWEAHSPAWRLDGTKLGFVQNLAGMRQIDPDPEPLHDGEILQTNWSATANYVKDLTWGPTAATAGQLLYAGRVYFDSIRIFRLHTGSTAHEEQLLRFESLNDVRGISWLPDGSGFVFALDEAYAGPANLFRYDFASETTIRLTNFADEWAGRPSISPDGTQVVFELAADTQGTRKDLVDPELWLVDIDGENLRMLVSSGRAPAWGLPKTPAEPTTPDDASRVFLPALRSAR